MLKEGEIFVQICKDYSKKKDKDYKPKCEIILGDIVVTRNPCLHPADVRKLKGVDYEELRHLVNVIVFPV